MSTVLESRWIEWIKPFIGKPLAGLCFQLVEDLVDPFNICRVRVHEGGPHVVIPCIGDKEAHGAEDSRIRRDDHL